MAPRANWKGFLRLSLVTCPVALYPATSDTEKVSFNQVNRKTGHRIKYVKVDADTGEEVPNEDIVKGYALDNETFIEVSKEELEELALESTRTIDIDEFVEKSEIDPRYLRPTEVDLLLGDLFVFLRLELDAEARCDLAADVHRPLDRPVRVAEYLVAVV